MHVKNTFSYSRNFSLKKINPNLEAIALCISIRIRGLKNKLVRQCNKLRMKRTEMKIFGFARIYDRTLGYAVSLTRCINA